MAAKTEKPDVRIAPASTDAELEEIYRFRYRIYVEDMGRYRSVADHQGKRLVEADDANSRQYAAWVGGRLAGTMRLTLGADAPLTSRHIAQYDLKAFLAEVPAEQIIIGERFMIEPEFRGGDLLFRMFCVYMELVNAERIQMIFGDCEPHLLNVYQALGFRTYTKRNVNSPETGYLIPLVIVAEDLSYLRKIHSPLTKVLQDFGGEARVPEAIDRLLAGGNAVLSQRLHGAEEYFAWVNQALAGSETASISLFDGLEPEEIQHCLDKSNTIHCARGDRVIKKDNVAQNMFMVLSGTLEARDGDSVVGVIAAGEVFGELAFFLHMPRTLDVYAASDDVAVLSFSETTIRSLIDGHSGTAAKLLRNVARILCVRLVKSH